MGLFFNRDIINELGVKGGASAENDSDDTTPETNDAPPEDDDSTGDTPPEDDDNDAPPEDNDTPPEDGDGPPEDDDNDAPPEDGDGPPEDDDNDAPPEDDNDSPPESDTLPDDDSTGDNPPEDSSNDDNDDTPEDDDNDAPPEDDDDSTDDGDMEDFDDDKEQTLSDMEDAIFSSLSPEQKTIKVLELKGSFVELFRSCDDILEKINIIPKENNTIETFEKITNNLINLKTYIEFYLSHTFDTKSYLENEVILQKYITIFNAIKDVFRQISGRK